jgi:Ser/Thr protein kinase RdoA (MazF antagonist)
MKAQGSKTMEKQLSYHRDRWLEQRESVLNAFVQRNNLSQAQSDQLWGLLAGEIDKMIDLLKNPESFENPERAATAWKEMLLDTDSAAHKVLDRDAAVAWDQQRQVERKFLWPWLPD